MSRTLELGISLLTAAEIRVVVLPIGPMPRDTFEAYLDALNAHRHVPLNATASFHQCGSKSPFAHLPYKTGAMHFRFLQAEDARRRSRIADLHAQRNVVALLGLLHCPLVEDLSAAHSEFMRSARQWPEALVMRCAAFEPSPAHLAAPTAKLQDLMIFPAGHLDQHLEVYMHEFAAAVLAAIEDHVLNANVSSIKLNTYVDSGEFLGSLAQIEEGLRKFNINEEEVKEKKRWGRLQKAKGDWSLLAGSPRDAFEHYKSAMELSRAAGDAIWFGAAVEGLAHARVVEALLHARAAAVGGSSSSHSHQPAANISHSGSAPAATLAAPTGSSNNAAEDEDADTAATTAKADEPPASSTAATEAGMEGENGAAGAAAEALTTDASAAESRAAAADAGVSIPSSTTAATTAESAAEAASPTATAKQRSNMTTGNITAPAAGPPGSNNSNNSSILYSLSGPVVCKVLATAELEGEVRELMAEARSWYKKKGGALPLQIEQSVKLCRFMACLAAGNAAAAASSGRAAASATVEALRAQLQSEIDAAVGLIMESLPGLGLQEDRVTALTEASQLLGLSGCGRKRLLLLWAALDLVRSGGTGPAAAAAGVGISSSTLGDLTPSAGAAVDVWVLLKLALLAMEPPEQPGQLDPDDALKVHWAIKRFIGWQQAQLQEAAAAAASQQPAAATSTGSSSSSSLAALLPSLQQLQQQPQQQFQQLLGPQLQLLSPAQAAALQSPCLQLPHIRRSQQTGSSPSKPGACSSTSRDISDKGGTTGGSSQQPGQLSGFTDAVNGVLAGLLNPVRHQQWLPGECLWDSLQVALLEVLVSVARVANAPVEAWEGAAILLRDYYPLLPQALQASLMEALSSTGTAMGSRLRLRPGPGPGPQVQLKRMVPGPACLQPQHLSGPLSGDGSSTGSTLRRADGPAGSQNPFIFNPWEAKRKGAKAAAAAEAALPEWVCGEEGRVEVLLVNPCATPLKLEALHLQVQPLLPAPQQPQQQDTAPAAAVTDGAVAGSGSSSSNSSSLGGSQQQQQGVSVMLAAGSKPTRVVLTYIPSRPGSLAITGVQATSKGVTWFQPFTQFPAVPGAPGGGAAAAAAVAAATGGRERSKPQGCFTVLVQPQLPLLKATLHGPEVQLVQPSEHDLSGFTAAAAAATAAANSAAASPSAGAGASGGWRAPAASLYSSPAATATAAGGGSGGSVGGAGVLEEKAVCVFEGQTLRWTLTLTNISSQPVTGCRVAIHNAKGVLLKTPLAPAAAAGAGQQHQHQQWPALPPSNLTGAYLEVQEQGLAVELPLNPGCSLSLPVSVMVGKPPGDSYDAFALQVRITYHGTASSSTSESKLLGRCLTLPVKLTIQPTIQVQSLRFLQQGLPLRNGARDDVILSKPQHLLLQSLRESREAAAGHGMGAAGAGSSSGGSILKRAGSLHVRNSSEGSLPAISQLGVGSMELLPKSPTKALATAATAGWPVGQQSEVQVSPVKHVSSGIRPGAAAAAAAAGGMLALSSQPVLELVVRNASERYFRMWLGALPDQLSADKALSAVAVLEPGDTQRLAAVVPEAVHAAASSTSTSSKDNSSQAAAAVERQHKPGQALAGSAAVAGLREPPRLAAAEVLVDRLAVCWEMITGAAAAGVLPHGCVHLEPLDVVPNLTPVALAALCPSPLSLRLAAPSPADVPGTQAPPHMVDLSTVLNSDGSSSGVQAPAAAASAATGLAGSRGAAVSSGVKLPGLTGPLWGLHMKVGQSLALDLQVTLATAGVASAAASVDESSSSSSKNNTGIAEPLLLQVTLFAVNALGASTALPVLQPSTPPAAAAALERSSSNIAALLAGHSFRGHVAAASVGTYKATEAAASSRAIAVAAAGSNPCGSLIDPGVFLTGCYNKLQVSVAPGTRQTYRLHALLVQPGLYVLGVADVQRMVSMAGNSSSNTAAVATTAERIYYNQDKLYVLVTR